MWYTILQDILGSPFGSFAFVFSILFLAGWLIHKISTFLAVWKLKEKDVVTLEDSINSIESRLIKIETQLSVFLPNISTLTQSHSPISLTELGEQTADRMQVRDMIEKNWGNICSLIQNNAASQSAYDIQQYCIEAATFTLDKLFTDADLNKIKTFAYNEGKPLGFYGSMIGVLIRDKYFKQKGINPSAADKPQQTT